METLYKNAPCLYFSFSDDGNTIAVNDTFTQQTGFLQEDVVGKKHDLFFTLSTRLFYQTHFFPLLKLHGQAAEIYITLKTKSGETIPVLMNANRQLVKEGYVIICTGIIVHNRKKYEDELVAAKKAAEQALLQNTALMAAKKAAQHHAELLDGQMQLVKKQNEELRQFNHAVTHEMQEPLRKLFIFTNLLLEEEPTATGERTVQKIRSVSEQIRTTLQGLQQYAWLIESGVTFKTILLKPIVTELAANLQKDISAISIQVAIEDHLSIEADAEQIKFMLLEIMTNAIKFRNADKPLQMSIRATPLHLNKYKAISDHYNYQECLKIEISDNGAGFDEAYREQVFQLFKRLHLSSGSGVGLTLCKKIVENHKGTIQINSKAGIGTTLTILLPVEQGLPVAESLQQTIISHDS